VDRSAGQELIFLFNGGQVFLFFYGRQLKEDEPKTKDLSRRLSLMGGTKS
jgi:hypothetical protein